MIFSLLAWKLRKLPWQGIFIEGARPLARLGFDGADVFREACYPLFLLIPNSTTFGTQRRCWQSPKPRNHSKKAVQGTFRQGARPLARLEIGFSGTPQKAPLFLSSVAFTPSAFVNSFSSYPTLQSASSGEKPQKTAMKAPSSRVPDPWPVLNLVEPRFFWNHFSSSFPGCQPRSPPPTHS